MKLCIVFFFQCFFLFSETVSSKEYIIGMPSQISNSQSTASVLLIMKEMLNRSYPGSTLKLKSFPSYLRMEVELENGSIDFMAPRIAQVVQDNPQFILIRPEIVKARYALIKKKGKPITISSLEDCYKYRLISFHGSRIYQQLFKDHMKPEQLIYVYDYQSGYKMIMADRADLFFDSAINIQDYISRPEYSGCEIAANPIAEEPLYFVTSVKDKEMVPALNQAFKSMTNDGTVSRLLRMKSGE